MQDGGQRHGKDVGYFQGLQIKLECAASNGNRYPPYQQVMATAISQ